MFRKMAFFEEVPPQRFFPTVHDSVLACKNKMAHFHQSTPPAGATPAASLDVPQPVLLRLKSPGAVNGNGSKLVFGPRPAVMPTVCEKEEHVFVESDGSESGSD